MKWILKRFRYVRDLEESRRELTLERAHHFGKIDMLNEMLDEYRAKQVRFSKLTLDEAETLFSSVVEYHRALRLLNVGDPVQHRILPIMGKYNITVERNTVVDKVIDEFEEFLSDHNDG